MTRALIAASLIVVMLCLLLGWSMLTAGAQTIGEPYPAHCIYYANGVAFDAPCQDHRVFAPLAVKALGYVLGPPPTPAPWEGE